MKPNPKERKARDRAREELLNRIWANTGAERERWVREYLWRYLWPEGTPGIDPMWLAARRQRRKRQLIIDLGLKVIQGGKSR